MAGNNGFSDAINTIDSYTNTAHDLTFNDLIHLFDIIQQYNITYDILQNTRIGVKLNNLRRHINSQHTPTQPCIHCQHSSISCNELCNRLRDFINKLKQIAHGTGTPTNKSKSTSVAESSSSSSQLEFIAYSNNNNNKIKSIATKPNQLPSLQPSNNTERNSNRYSTATGFKVKQVADDSTSRLRKRKLNHDDEITPTEYLTHTNNNNDNDTHNTIESINSSSQSSTHQCQSLKSICCDILTRNVNQIQQLNGVPIELSIKILRYASVDTLQRIESNTIQLANELDSIWYIHAKKLIADIDKYKHDSNTYQQLYHQYHTNKQIKLQNIQHKLQLKQAAVNAEKLANSSKSINITDAARAMNKKPLPGKIFSSTSGRQISKPLSKLDVMRKQTYEKVRKMFT